MFYFDLRIRLRFLEFERNSCILTIREIILSYATVFESIYS